MFQVHVCEMLISNASFALSAHMLVEGETDTWSLENDVEPRCVDIHVHTSCALKGGLKTVLSHLPPWL